MAGRCRVVLLAIVLLEPSVARAAARTPEAASTAAQAALRSCLGLDGAPGVAACREALAIPSSPARRALLTELLARKLDDLRRWSEAAAAYADLLELRPQDAEARVELGEVLLYGLGRAADAVPVLREALLRDPNEAQAWGHLGVALNSLGRYDEAVSSFEEALKRDPDFLDSRPAAKEALDASRRSERWP